MDICLSWTGIRCGLCELRRQQRRERTKARFHELMKAVWQGDLRTIAGILARDPRLVNYCGFTFPLSPPCSSDVHRTTSILDYARVLGNRAVMQCLAGVAEA